MDPYANPTTEFADVVIPVAISGIEAEGSVYRMDNIPLRLRKLVETEYMIDEEIIKEILKEVRALRNGRKNHNRDNHDKRIRYD